MPTRREAPRRHPANRNRYFREKKSPKNGSRHGFFRGAKIGIFGKNLQKVAHREKRGPATRASYLLFEKSESLPGKCAVGRGRHRVFKIFSGLSSKNNPPGAGGG